MLPPRESGTERQGAERMAETATVRSAAGLAGAAPRPLRRADRLPLLIALGFIALTVLRDPWTYVSLVGVYAPRWPMMVVACVVLVVPIMALSVRGGSPLRDMHRIAGRCIPPLLVGLPLYFLFKTAYTANKVAITGVVPFWADEPLMRLDRWIWGTDPYRLAHQIVPDWLLPSLNSLYVFGWLVQWFVMIALALVWWNERDRCRYLLTHLGTLIVAGTLLATGLSSFGPILYDRFMGTAEFADLAVLLKGYGPIGPPLGADYLHTLHMAGQGSSGLAAGISAMPSVHVALAACHALFLWRMSRIAGVLGVAMLAAIWFCSVLSGWHYSTDGLVSIAVVGTLWWVSGRVVARLFGDDDGERPLRDRRMAATAAPR